MTARRRSAPPTQSDLFAAEPGLPAGFVYREELISPGEERAMAARFGELPFRPFEFTVGNQNAAAGFEAEFSFELA